MIVTKSTNVKLVSPTASHETTVKTSFTMIVLDKTLSYSVEVHVSFVFEEMGIQNKP